MDDNTKLLKDIKEVLEIVASKVKLIEVRQTTTSHQITFIKDQQSVMNEKLDDLNNQLIETKDWMGEELGKVNIKVDQLLEAKDQTKNQIKEIKQHIGLPN